MDTQTIIYVVAGALILRVIVKLIFKFNQDVSQKSEENEVQE